MPKSREIDNQVARPRGSALPGRSYAAPLVKPARWLLLCLLIFAVLPRLSRGQTSAWERLVQEGNQALGRGALLEAEARFQAALALSEQFAPEDLRRATSRRNLAQTLTQLGQLDVADSLYGAAISIAGRALLPAHGYLRSLHDERARLREAMELSAREEVTPPRAALTFWERVLAVRTWLIYSSVIHLGATVPLGGELAATHAGGLSFGLSLPAARMSLGPLPVTVGIGHTTISLPTLHADAVPLVAKGTVLTLEPSLGRWTLDAGAGIFSVKSGGQRDNVLGLVAGLNLAILRRLNPEGKTGLDVVLQARNIALFSAGPTGGMVNSVQLGFTLSLSQ